jgi:hypothetical protein
MYKILIQSTTYCIRRGNFFFEVWEMMFFVPFVVHLDTVHGKDTSIRKRNILKSQLQVRSKRELIIEISWLGFLWWNLPTSLKSSTWQ